MEMATVRCPLCNGPVKEPAKGALRRTRVAAGLGLREFAARLSLSAAYISDVELNRRRVTKRLMEAYRDLER